MGSMFKPGRCVFAVLLGSMLLSSAVAQASGASNHGLPEGTPIPAWAVGKHVQFVPSFEASSTSEGPSNEAKNIIKGKPKGIHNQLSQRCEPGYCPTPPLLNIGGSGVQNNPILYPIFWGANWNTTGAATRQSLMALLNGLSGSPYQGILTQYYDTSGRISSNVTVATPYIDASVAAPNNVETSTIEAEIAQGISVNKWSRTFDAQFIVLPAPGSTYSNYPNYCAYHSYDIAGSSYGLIPYAGDEPFKQLCSGYDPAKNVSNVTSMMLSHEYAETATDPKINTWLTSDGYEVADICASSDDVLPNGAYVQGLWDNAQGICSLSDLNPPIEKPEAFFADANKGSISNWSRNSIMGFHPTFFGSDSIAAGTSPSSLDVNGTPHVFFSDAKDNGAMVDWPWNPATGWQLTHFYKDSVAAGTSPSAVMINGVPHVFFSDANDNGSISDWSLNPSTGWQLTHFYKDSVAAKSSPSAVVVNGTPHVLFSSLNDNGAMVDWTLNSSTGWQLSHLYKDSVAAGTSPSAVMVNGAPEVFFSSLNDNGAMSVWVLAGTWQLVHFYKDSVAAKSSPSAVVTGTTPHVFFSDANDNREISEWTWSSTEGWHLVHFFQDQAVTGTSPSAIG